MNGQMKKSNRQVVEEFISRVNPYEKPNPIAFDLRSYAAYVAEHELSADEITPEIMAKFSTAVRP